MKNKIVKISIAVIWSIILLTFFGFAFTEEGKMFFYKITDFFGIPLEYVGKVIVNPPIIIKYLLVGFGVFYIVVTSFILILSSIIIITGPYFYICQNKIFLTKGKKCSNKRKLL
jgi:hypothetical protein